MGKSRDLTWEKPLHIGGKSVPKRKVRERYERLWYTDPLFREELRSGELVAVADFEGKPTIRRGIRVSTLDELRDAVKQHTVGFFRRSEPFLDVDIPLSERRYKKDVLRVVREEAKRLGLKPKEEVDTPGGIHFVPRGATPSQVKELARRAAERVGGKAGRTSESGIVFDASNRERAIPGSLGIQGGEYRRIRSVKPRGQSGLLSRIAKVLKR